MEPQRTYAGLYSRINLSLGSMQICELQNIITNKLKLKIFRVHTYLWLRWRRSMDGEGLERVKLVVLRTSDVGFSTGFLERFRPRWMWRSQYLCPVTTSLEHLHFLPSVLRHLPGSGSMVPLPQYPVRSTDPPHPYVHIFKQKIYSKWKSTFYRKIFKNAHLQVVW